MAWVIAVLGAALAAGGGVALWNGSGYIRLDWGQAETVAGTVALSAGVVTIAIAAVLFAIRDALRDTLREDARGEARGALRRPAPFPAAGVGLEAVHLDEEAGGGAPEGPAAIAPARNRFAGALARVGVPKPERADPASADPGAAEPPPPAMAAPPEAEPAYREPVLAERTYAEPAHREPAYEPRPRAAPIAAPEAPRPAAPAVAEAPTVVGRYEANGASYVLFSDGTIEVETEGGTHRFASMSALKDHIERQDAG